MKTLALVLLFALATLQVALADPIIFLVRHAEKAQDGDAKDPDLSDAGRVRAEALAAMLKDAKITAIYATEFKRTQQTAEPLAHAVNVPITIVPAKAATVLVAKLKLAQGNALVVGHSNTLPEIIKELGTLEALEISEADFDQLFVLIPGTGTAPRLLQLHYH